MKKEYTKIRQFYAWVGFIVCLIVAVVSIYALFSYMSTIDLQGSQFNYQTK